MLNDVPQIDAVPDTTYVIPHCGNLPDYDAHKCCFACHHRSPAPRLDVPRKQDHILAIFTRHEDGTLTKKHVTFRLCCAQARHAPPQAMIESEQIKSLMERHDAAAKRRTNVDANRSVEADNL